MLQRPLDLLANGTRSQIVDAERILTDLLGLNISDKDVIDSMLMGIYCSANSVLDKCIGLCENSDIAGPGVRASFYAQSLLNAILMAVSPEDAPAACWGAALLTSAVIIPSIIQKRMREITLHHALVVLGFATMSTIATFASAPFCSFWRAADFPRGLEDSRSTTVPVNNSLFATSMPAIPQNTGLTTEVVGGSSPATSTGLNTPSVTDKNIPPAFLADQLNSALVLPEANDFRRVKWSSKNYRSRVLLSVALITQISLTWAWAVYLFVDPHYAQTPCSAETKVVFFWKRWEVSWISNYGPRYLLFPGWLLFCMLMTLAWGIALVHASDIDFPLVGGVEILGFWRWCRRAATLENTQKRAVVLSNVAAGVFWLFLLVNSELQVRANKVFDETNDWGFGQISALLLAAAPLWPITNALHMHWKAQTEELQRLRTPSSMETLTVRPEQPISLTVLPPTPSESSSDLESSTIFVANTLSASPARRTLNFERTDGPLTHSPGRSVSSSSIPSSSTALVSQSANSDADQYSGSFGRRR